jgi:PAS domain-containing protein
MERLHRPLAAGEPGRRLARRLHPDDREDELREWRRANGREACSSSHRLFDVEAMCYRRFQTHATPVRDADGRVLEWLGSSVEVEDLQQAEELQQPRCWS